MEGPTHRRRSNRSRSGSGSSAASCIGGNAPPRTPLPRGREGVPQACATAREDVVALIIILAPRIVILIILLLLILTIAIVIVVIVVFRGGGGCEARSGSGAARQPRCAQQRRPRVG